MVISTKMYSEQCYGFKCEITLENAKKVKIVLAFCLPPLIYVCRSTTVVCFTRRNRSFIHSLICMVLRSIVPKPGSSLITRRSVISALKGIEYPYEHISAPRYLTKHQKLSGVFWFIDWFKYSLWVHVHSPLLSEMPGY